MSTLKNILFPDTNITGYTDRNNQPILVGQRLVDENKDEWDVVFYGEKYRVKTLIIPEGYIELGAFIILSEWVEIVVQKPEQNEALVAIAPFRDIKKSKVKTKRSY